MFIGYNNSLGCLSKKKSLGQIQLIKLAHSPFLEYSSIVH